MQNLEHFVYEVALSEELLPSGTLFRNQYQKRNIHTKLSKES